MRKTFTWRGVHSRPDCYDVVHFDGLTVCWRGLRHYFHVPPWEEARKGSKRYRLIVSDKPSPDAQKVRVSKKRGYIKIWGFKRRCGVYDSTYRHMKYLFGHKWFYAEMEEL